MPNILSNVVDLSFIDKTVRKTRLDFKYIMLNFLIWITIITRNLASLLHGKQGTRHRVKSVQIWSFYWSVFEHFSHSENKKQHNTKKIQGEIYFNFISVIWIALFL